MNNESYDKSDGLSCTRDMKRMNVHSSNLRVVLIVARSRRYKLSFK